jgi:hypothetical protein
MKDYSKPRWIEKPTPSVLERKRFGWGYPSGSHLSLKLRTQIMPTMEVAGRFYNSSWLVGLTCSSEGTVTEADKSQSFLPQEMLYALSKLCDEWKELDCLLCPDGTLVLTTETFQGKMKNVAAYPATTISRLTRWQKKWSKPEEIALDPFLMGVSTIIRAGLERLPATRTHACPDHRQFLWENIKPDEDFSIDLLYHYGQCGYCYNLHKFYTNAQLMDMAVVSAHELIRQFWPTIQIPIHHLTTNCATHPQLLSIAQHKVEDPTVWKALLTHVSACSNCWNSFRLLLASE